MGILRRLREWREDKDGTLIGPNIDADSVDAGSVNTDERSYTEGYTEREDGNSPVIESGVGEAPISLSGTYDKIKVKVNLIENTEGSDQDLFLQLDGVSENAYFGRKTDGTSFGSENKIPLCEPVLSGETFSTEFTIHNANTGSTFPYVTGPTGRAGSQPGVLHAVLTRGKQVNEFNIFGASSGLNIEYRVLGENL